MRARAAECIPVSSCVSPLSTTTTTTHFTNVNRFMEKAVVGRETGTDGAPCGLRRGTDPSIWGMIPFNPPRGPARVSGDVILARPLEQSSSPFLRASPWKETLILCMLAAGCTLGSIHLPQYFCHCVAKQYCVCLVGKIQHCL